MRNGCRRFRGYWRSSGSLRSTLSFTDDEAGLLHAYVGTKPDREGPDWSPVFSIAPSTLVPVVREHYDDEGELQRTLEPARWGLRPSWAKEKGPRPIKAASRP